MLGNGKPPLYHTFHEGITDRYRIEAACYFLASPDGARSKHASTFKSSIQELVDMIEKAQQEDGYLIIYFTVVDKEGRFKNLRDMHEMCEYSPRLPLLLPLSILHLFVHPSL
jgi:DUF1680 family protein